jgi:hypothetical protein
MKTIQGLLGAVLVSILALSGCTTTDAYNKPMESAGPVVPEPTDPELTYWSGVAVKQLGECLDELGTVDEFNWLAFEYDPTAFGALYVYFSDGEYGSVALLGREWANGDDFVVPWTDKDSEILDSVKCFD